MPHPFTQPHPGQLAVNALLSGAFSFDYSQFERSIIVLQNALKQLDALLTAAKTAKANGTSVHIAIGFDQLSAKQYQRLKTEQDAATSAQAQLQTFTPSDFPFPAQLVADFLSAYRTYNLRVRQVLEAWDTSHQDGTYFQHISESELWQRRNKAYEYLI